MPTFVLATSAIEIVSTASCPGMFSAFATRPESPNHALQRTGSAVTAPAADHHHLSAHRQVPRPLRLPLSLGRSAMLRAFSERAK
jgi:hypothetical protein